MKLDPGFPTHWKTEMLIERLGAEGIVTILRIWGRAQIRREWTGIEWTPKRLAMETKWKGDENHLWTVLTDPDAPWLDLAEDGTVSIHGFEEYQKQVIHLWGAGGKGGRPKKDSAAPPSKTKEENISSYSSSSSYPIGFLNENHLENHLVSEVAVAEDAYDRIPTGNKPDMLARERRIQSVKSDWKLPLTYAEQQILMQNANCLDGISEDEWKTIKEWMRAKLPQGEAARQPYSRGKFIEWLPDVYRHAMQWARKNPSNQSQNLPPGHK